VQEHAQVREVVSIQMPLLLVKRRELSGCGVLMPEVIA
jgi:hypothetical protein